MKRNYKTLVETEDDLDEGDDCSVVDECGDYHETGHDHMTPDKHHSSSASVSSAGHSHEGSLHDLSDHGHQYHPHDEKVEKNRERNREHAKRTRLRKKEMMESMKMRLLELQRESARLEQLLEESNTANILLCLSVKQDGSNAVPSSSGAGLEGSQSEKNGSQMHSSSSMEDLDSDNYNSGKVLANKGNIIDQLRQKVRVEAASSLKDKSGESEDEYGEMKGHNVSTWQNGQNLATTDKASPGQAENKSSGDLETIKRERNRMHAKLTRDRKKLFTSRMQQTIQTLERHNQLLRNRLNNMIFTGIGRSTSGNHLVAIKEEATHLPPPLTSLPIPGFPPAHPVGLGHPALPNAYARASAVTNLANMNAYTKFGLMTANGWMGPMFPRSWPASYEYNTSIQPMPGAASAFPLPIPNTSNSNPHANHGNNPSNANV